MFCTRFLLAIRILVLLNGNALCCGGVVGVVVGAGFPAMTLAGRLLLFQENGDGAAEDKKWREENRLGNGF